MLSLAIVSLSPCSEAISSRTGATILHGPHHSAQKSTRTGLSLPRTSSAKVASVTVTVLPAMGRSPSRSAGPRRLQPDGRRSEEHTSELQSRQYLVCRLLLEKKISLVLVL